jgi:hypothetical protein
MPEMTALAGLMHQLAQIMTDRRGVDLDPWMKEVREAVSPNSASHSWTTTRDYSPLTNIG